MLPSRYPVGEAVTPIAQLPAHQVLHTRVVDARPWLFAAQLAYFGYAHGACRVTSRHAMHAVLDAGTKHTLATCLTACLRRVQQPCSCAGAEQITVCDVQQKTAECLFAILRFQQGFAMANLECWPEIGVTSIVIKGRQRDMLRHFRALKITFMHLFWHRLITCLMLSGPLNEIWSSFNAGMVSVP